MMRIVAACLSMAIYFSSYCQTELNVGLGLSLNGFEHSSDHHWFPNDGLANLDYMPAVKFRHFVSDRISFTANFSTVRIREKLTPNVLLNWWFTDYSSRIFMLDIGAGYRLFSNLTIGVSGTAGYNANEMTWSDFEFVINTETSEDYLNYVLGYAPYIEFSSGRFSLELSYRNLYNISKTRRRTRIAIPGSKYFSRFYGVELKLFYNLFTWKKSKNEGCETGL